MQADNSEQLRRLRAEAISLGLPYTDFTDTMTLKSSAEQLALTSQTPEAKLDYLGLAIFGPTETLRPLTKKFSLFRD